MTLYQRLNEYSESDYYGFHMPGHKRNRNLMGNGLPYSIDITEIEGFDDLHHAANVLKEAQERAARVYGAQESHFLINGSTAGILSAVLEIHRGGMAVLVARNCHKSVYHGIYLNDLKPYYLYPEFRQDIELNTGISGKRSENCSLKSIQRFGRLLSYPLPMTAFCRMSGELHRQFTRKGFR